METHDSRLWRERLSAYADSALGVPERAGVAAHLGVCGSCREEVKAVKALKRAVGGAPAPALPEDLRQALLGEARRLENREAGRPASLKDLWRAWRMVLVPAGASLALGGALVLLQPEPRGAEEEAVSVDALLSEHRRYEEARPVGPADGLLAEPEEDGQSGPREDDL